MAAPDREFVDLRYVREFPHPVETAFAWLTDYRDDDHTLTDRILNRRTVTARTPEKVSMDMDMHLLSRVRTPAEVRLFPPDRYEARPIGRRGPSQTVFRYKLDPTPRGCRLTLDFHVHVRNPVRRAVTRMVLPVLKRRVARMWDGFAAAMEKDLGKGVAVPA